MDKKLQVFCWKNFSGEPYKKSTRVELTEYYNLGRDATSQGEIMDMINGIDL